MPKESGNKTNKNIHHGHRERLRKSIDRDPELSSLSDFEVLEYILTFFIPRKDTNPIAHDLLEKYYNLAGVFSAPVEELASVPNMTKTAAHAIGNLLAVLRRVEISRTVEKTKVKRVEQAVEILRPYFRARNCEMVYMLSVDTHDRLLSVELICSGMNNVSTVDIGKLVANASRSSSAKLILAHNHPGGLLEPSPEDVSVTATISLAVNSINKELVDHIIFTDEGYFSFYEHGIIERILRGSDKLFATDRAKEVSSRVSLGAYVLEKNDENSGN